MVNPKKGSSFSFLAEQLGSRPGIDLGFDTGPAVPRLDQGGFRSKAWDPVVHDRLCALQKRLGPLLGGSQGRGRG